TANGVATATGELRVYRRRHAIRIEVVRTDQRIGRLLNGPPRGAEVPCRHADIGAQLMLNLDRLLPVVWARAETCQHVRVVRGRIRVVQAEILVTDGTADVAAASGEILGRRVRQITVGREVPVRVRPGSVY